MEKINFYILSPYGDKIGPYKDQNAAEEAALDFSYKKGEEYLVIEVYKESKKKGPVMGQLKNKWNVEHDDSI